MTPQRIYAIAAMLSVSAVNADELVNRADANGDGFVSLYELRAAHYADIEFNRRIEKSFAEYDTDGDGLISEAERSAKRAETTAAGATAATAAIVTVDAPTTDTGADGSANRSGDALTAAVSADASPPKNGGLSRTESWILQIDADNSGGASVAELVASGDGRQWFTDKAFESADRNGDRDLDPDELEVLLQSLERRRR